MFFITKIRRRRRQKKNSEYLKYKEAARALVISRALHFNSFYNFTYHKITIRNQSSRWGSCSRKGNMNFNYRLALLPFELADYIIVHELCHLGEFNHSKAFWDLVARTIPHHVKLRNELRKKGKELF